MTVDDAIFNLQACFPEQFHCVLLGHVWVLLQKSGVLFYSAHFDTPVKGLVVDCGSVD